MHVPMLYIYRTHVFPLRYTEEHCQVIHHCEWCLQWKKKKKKDSMNLSQFFSATQWKDHGCLYLKCFLNISYCCFGEEILQYSSLERILWTKETGCYSPWDRKVSDTTEWLTSLLAEISFLSLLLGKALLSIDDITTHRVTKAKPKGHPGLLSLPWWISFTYKCLWF